MAPGPRDWKEPHPQPPRSHPQPPRSNKSNSNTIPILPSRESRFNTPVPTPVASTSSLTNPFPSDHQKYQQRPFNRPAAHPNNRIAANHPKLDTPPHILPTGPKNRSITPSRRTFDSREESGNEQVGAGVKKSKANYSQYSNQYSNQVGGWKDASISLTNSIAPYSNLHYNRFEDRTEGKGKGRDSNNNLPLFNQSQSPAPSRLPINNSSDPPISTPAPSLPSVENPSTGLLSDGRYLNLLGREREDDKFIFDWVVSIPFLHKYGDRRKEFMVTCFEKIKDIGGELVRNGSKEGDKQQDDHFFVYRIAAWTIPALSRKDSIRSNEIRNVPPVLIPPVLTPSAVVPLASSLTPPVLFDRNNEICSLLSSRSGTGSGLDCSYAIPADCAGEITPLTIKNRREFKVLVENSLSKDGWKLRDGTDLTFTERFPRFMISLIKLAVVEPSIRAISLPPTPAVTLPAQPRRVTMPAIPPIVKMELDVPEVATIPIPSETTEFIKRIALPRNCIGVGVGVEAALRGFISKIRNECYELEQLMCSHQVENNELVISYELRAKEKNVVDIKPVITQALAPTPIRKEVSFEYGMKSSRSFAFDSYENNAGLKVKVEEFLVDYCNRFDESRQSLIDYYTAEASFTSRCIHTPPIRLQSLTAVRPFSSKYQRTPTPIINAIASLPAGKHSLNCLVYDIQQINSKFSKTFLLTFDGLFTEFQPETKRSFSRSFVLLEAGNRTGGGAKHFVILSDAIVWKHYLPLVSEIPIGIRKESLPTTSITGPPVVKTVTKGVEKIIEEDDSDSDCFIVDDSVQTGPVEATAAVSEDWQQKIEAKISAIDSQFSLFAAKSAELESRTKEVEDREKAVIARAREIELQRGKTPPEPRKEVRESENESEQELPVKKLKKKKKKEVEVIKVPKVKNLVTLGPTNFISHNRSAKTNKMRFFFSTPRSKYDYLAFTNNGDLVSYSSKSSVVKTLFTAKTGVDRVDVADINEKGEFIMGFMGDPKEKQGPANQVVYFDSNDSNAIVKPFDQQPHANGVTAILHMPAQQSTKFITAGQDKSFYLWENLVSPPGSGIMVATTRDLGFTRSSTITGLAWINDWMIGVGYDKKVVAYDLSLNAIRFERTQAAQIHQVVAIPNQPACALIISGTTNNQFNILDFRLPKNQSSTEFGFQGALGASGKSLGLPTPLGRFFKGGFSSTNLWAFPDAAEGVLIFDIRMVGMEKEKGKEGSAVVQRIPGIGRAKVLDVQFGAGDKSLVLLTASGFGRVEIK